MEVHLPSASATQENANEFNVISTARSFTLAASSMHGRNEWMCALSEAIAELQSKQLTFPSKMSTDTGEFRQRLGQQVRVPKCLKQKWHLIFLNSVLRLRFGFRTAELQCANFVLQLSALLFDVTIAVRVARQVKVLRLNYLY